MMESKKLLKIEVIDWYFNSFGDRDLLELSLKFSVAKKNWLVNGL